MENFDNLGLLEKAVEKLMDSVGGMKKENLVLEARVESRDQEISSLKKEISALQEERGQVQKRVSGLLGAIEKWEKLKETQDEVKPQSKGIEEKTLF